MNQKLTQMRTLERHFSLQLSRGGLFFNDVDDVVSAPITPNRRRAKTFSVVFSLKPWIRTWEFWYSKRELTRGGVVPVLL
mmetsp:Transcript_23839/g.32545  ORF Transcript_23839/g.32545 Transcript_23839/m.32545 type:complete len:80 (+) Transcript_23839:249-488(+)